MTKKWILASASPRRQELIQLFGHSWETKVADVDEDSVDHPDPAYNVVATAQLKAEAVADIASNDALIIAADTTVVLGNRLLNKPVDEQEARAMLQLLRGRTHQVHTGIVLFDKAIEVEISDVATIDVPMRNYKDTEIEAYIASGDPLDKAGAYAIQHPGFRPVEGLTGCYSGVMGLPLCHLARAMRQLNVVPDVDIAAACQNHHDYDCPIHEAVLSSDPSRSPIQENLAKYR